MHSYDTKTQEIKLVQTVAGAGTFNLHYKNLLNYLYKFSDRIPDGLIDAVPVVEQQTKQRIETLIKVEETRNTINSLLSHEAADIKEFAKNADSPIMAAKDFAREVNGTLRQVDYQIGRRRTLN